MMESRLDPGIYMKKMRDEFNQRESSSVNNKATDFSLLLISVKRDVKLKL